MADAEGAGRNERSANKWRRLQLAWQRAVSKFVVVVAAVVVVVVVVVAAVVAAGDGRTGRKWKPLSQTDESWPAS